MHKPLEELLDRMAALPPTELPFVSLYLNLEKGDGRPRFERFLRKELKRRVRTFELRTSARESIEHDAERIWEFLRETVDPRAESAVVFACHGEGIFEAVQSEAAIEGHHLHVADRPELYHLARLVARHPRCAALVADTNAARILVFARGETIDRDVLQSDEKTSRTSVGGWSQMRYQRHNEDVHLHHAREVVEHLDRIVARDDIDSIVLAGDERIVPLLRRELPERLEKKIVDDVRLDFHTPDGEVLEKTVETVRARDAEEDAQAVERLIGVYQADGLAVVGPAATREALEIGQVDEVLIAASASELTEEEIDPPEESARLPEEEPDEPGRVQAEVRSTWRAADLVAQARRTGAAVRFVEDASLLRAIGGVGARLRYR